MVNWDVWCLGFVLCVRYFFLFLFYLCYLYECFAESMCVYHVCVWCLQRSRECIRSPGIRGIHAWTTVWVLGTEPWFSAKQYMFLTIKLSLQPLRSLVLIPIFIYSETLWRRTTSVVTKTAATHHRCYGTPEMQPVCMWSSIRVKHIQDSNNYLKKNWVQIIDFLN